MYLFVNILVFQIYLHFHIYQPKILSEATIKHFKITLVRVSPSLLYLLQPILLTN